ncbi:MAG: HD domain-containing protein [Thermoflexales bacterium]|nr:HD domain-containing protein [Thermoflexales bacterium]
MRYHDRIYGDFEIDHPAVLAVMQTRAMQRLHGVLQHGITGLIGITHPTSRFEHSLGVMWLVRHLGGTLNAQIAALLHDISHTAFSHVIDYVVENHDHQSYHEDKKAWFVAQSDVPATLIRHDIDLATVLHEEEYALLEQPAPRLCADRLDYFLRDSVDLGLASLAEVRAALDHLVVADGRIVTNDVAVAHWLADTYMAADKQSWANFREVGVYEVTARAIRAALNLGAITEADFWLTDAELWRKLCDVQDGDFQRQIALISPATRFEWDDVSPAFRVSTKLRTLDPDVLIEGRLFTLSELDADFARQRTAYLRDNTGKWPMRVIA